jgi:hypothetical protein
MTLGVFGSEPESAGAGGLDPLSVDHVAPFVAFLASPAAARINGQVFVVHGGKIALMAAPSVERRFDTTQSTWTAGELAGTVGAYFADRDPARTFASTEVLSL